MYNYVFTIFGMFKFVGKKEWERNWTPLSPKFPSLLKSRTKHLELIFGDNTITYFWNVQIRREEENRKGNLVGACSSMQFIYFQHLFNDFTYYMSFQDD